MMPPDGHRHATPHRDRLVERAIQLGARRRAGDPVGVRAGARGARHRHAQGALRPVHRRPRGAVERRRDVRDRSTPPPSSRSPRSPARRRPTSTRRSAPRGGPSAGRGAACPAASGPSTCSGSRASSRSAVREFAVLESMDSGKPIKESRDVDVPLAAAHFWYYAGWADKLEYAFPGRVARPLGVAAQIIPWNFPLLMLAWKIAPGAGRRQHGRPQAGLDDAALGPPLRRGLPPGRPAARASSTSSRDPARSACRLVTHPDVDKVAFTGSTEIGRKIVRGVAGTDKALTLELGGKAANIVFDDAPLDQAIEGIVNGIYFNQGEVCCAGSRLLVQESIAETAHRQAQGPPVDDPRRRPARQEHRRRRDQLEEPAREDHRARRRAASPRAPSCTSRPATCRSAATSSGPTLFTNVAQSHRIAREEIFGPVLSVLTFRTPDEAVEKANNTPYGLSAGRLDRQGQPDPRDGLASSRPASSGRTRSTASTRRRRSAATRSPASAARAACTACTPTSGSRTADRGLPHAPGLRAASIAGRRGDPGRDPAHRGPQDLQAVHRRGVPADRERPLVPRQGRGRDAARQRLPGVAQGPARRRPGRPQGAARLGRQDRDEPRPGPVPRRRADGGPARPVRGRGRGRGGASATPVPARSSTGRSTAGSGTPAGPTRSPRCWARPTRSPRPYFNFTIPEATGVVGVVAPETSSLLGLVSRLAPPLVAGNAVVLLTSRDAAAAGGHADARCSRRRTCPAASSTS